MSNKEIQTYNIILRIEPDTFDLNRDIEKCSLVLVDPREDYTSGIELVSARLPKSLLIYRKTLFLFGMLDACAKTEMRAWE